MKEIIMLRVELIAKMNEYLIKIGDEDILEEWYQIYPDEADNDDLIEIAKDEDLWLDAVEMFSSCCQLLRGF